jgi:hypothetical protein
VRCRRCSPQHDIRLDLTILKGHLVFFIRFHYVACAAQAQQIPGINFATYHVRRLRGYWLQQAGFEVGQRVRVHVTEQCITIVPAHVP